MSSTTTSKEKDITFVSKSDFGNWGRIVNVDIYDTGGDSTLGKNDWGSPIFHLDGKELDIEFTSSCSCDDNSSDNATLTLKNLNKDTQWGIKIYMGITITAGYEGKGNSGLVVCGIINNIKDSYDTNGNVTLELTIVQSYNYESKIIQRDSYPIGTPFKDIIEDVCAEVGFPVNMCAIEGDEYVTTMETPYTGTVSKIVTDLVEKANAIRVKNGDITQKDKNAGRRFTQNTDKFYLDIIDYDQENTEVAFQYSAQNGLISIERGDLFSDSSMSDDAVTIEAEIIFNWRIRIGQYISIESKRQPHLNGMYRTESYEMNGSSKGGTHTVRLTLRPAGGSAETYLTDLASLYKMNYEKGPSSD